MRRCLAGSGGQDGWLAAPDARGEGALTWPRPGCGAVRQLSPRAVACWPSPPAARSNSHGFCLSWFRVLAAPQVILLDLENRCDRGSSTARSRKNLARPRHPGVAIDAILCALACTARRRSGRWHRVMAAPTSRAPCRRRRSARDHRIDVIRGFARRHDLINSSRHAFEHLTHSRNFRSPTPAEPIRAAGRRSAPLALRARGFACRQVGRRPRDAWSRAWALYLVKTRFSRSLALACVAAWPALDRAATRMLLAENIRRAAARPALGGFIRPATAWLHQFGYVNSLPLLSGVPAAGARRAVAGPAAARPRSGGVAGAVGGGGDHAGELPHLSRAERLVPQTRWPGSCCSCWAC